MFELSWELWKQSSSVSFCTYVRLAVEITQLLKHKFCANIPARINILIPLFVLFFSFCCLVFTQLDHSVKECFTQQLSGARSPHLQHPPDPCPSLPKKLHHPRNRRSPDFNPIRRGRNVIPWRKPHCLSAALLQVKCNHLRGIPVSQAADTGTALYVLVVWPIQISGLWTQPSDVRILPKYHI